MKVFILQNLDKENGQYLVFKNRIKRQGHEYYQGASGSPIADPEGAITSILIGGCEKTGLLRAFRLDNVDIKINNGC